MARKGYSYIRFSGKWQEAGDSYRRQDDLAERAAREEGVPLDRTVSLADKGISAFRGRNWKKGDLGKFIDLVDAGVISPGSVLIIERVNRLSRMPWMDQVELWKELLRRGIIIRTCEPAYRYTKDNMNELAVGCPVVLLMMLAHQESLQKSEWASATWEEKIRRAAEEKKPHGGNCPRWLQPVTARHPQNPDRKVTVGYRVIEAKAKIVQTAFELSLQGWGAGRIARHFRESNAPRLHRSGWTPGKVQHLLKCRTVLGEYQPQGRGESGRVEPVGNPIPDYYPAIVSENDFLNVQNQLRNRRRKGGRPGEGEANLFTFLVRDAATGNRLRLRKNTNQRGGVYHYLATPGLKLVARYDVFEEGMVSCLASLKASHVDGRHEANALASRVERLQGERCRLGQELDALDAQMRELPPQRWPQRVVARISELEEAIRQKTEELRLAKEEANTSGRTEVLTEVKTLLERLEETKGTEEGVALRQRVKLRVRMLVESVWVKAQVIDKANRYLHVLVYLHGGERRYFRLQIGLCKKEAPWSLADADFRADWEGKNVGAQSTPV
jgi:hypothetical protein